jgi:hypothetical protein
VTISRAFLRAGLATPALFLAAALFQAGPARANIVFDFSGTCLQNCSGTATAVLTLTDSYTFGTDITLADFISFDYLSSLVSFAITSAENPGIGGGLNADGSINQPSGLIIDDSVFAGNGPFFEATPGSQFVSFANVAEATGTDAGAPFAFTLVSGAVPEPSTWAMILLGFCGLGFAGYRASRRAAASA